MYKHTTNPNIKRPTDSITGYFTARNRRIQLETGLKQIIVPVIALIVLFAVGIMLAEHYNLGPIIL